MEVITYKCPNCGGDLTFDPASGKYKCEYCLSSFTEEEAERANPKAAEALNGEDVCCRCTGSIRCTEGKQYGGNKRGNRAGRSSCLHLPELRRRDCDRCDDGSDIPFLLPQPGGAFRPALGRIYAGFRAAV